MKNFANLLKEYKQKDIKRVKIAITDIDGVLRGKYVSASTAPWLTAIL